MHEERGKRAAAPVQFQCACHAHDLGIITYEQRRAPAPPSSSPSLAFSDGPERGSGIIFPDFVVVCLVPTEDNAFGLMITITSNVRAKAGRERQRKNTQASIAAGEAARKHQIYACAGSHSRRERASERATVSVLQLLAAVRVVGARPPPHVGLALRDTGSSFCAHPVFWPFSNGRDFPDDRV